MKIEAYKVWYQYYVLPTIYITADRRLNGYYEINFCWLNRGVAIQF